MRPLGAATFSAPVGTPRMTTALLHQRRCGGDVEPNGGGNGGRLHSRQRRRRRQYLHDDTACSLGHAGADAAPHPESRQCRGRLRVIRRDRRRRRRGRERRTRSERSTKVVKVVPQLLDVAGALGRVGRGQGQDGSEQVQGRGWEDGGGREVGTGGNEGHNPQILEGCGDGLHSFGRRQLVVGVCVYRHPPPATRRTFGEVGWLCCGVGAKSLCENH